MKAVQAAAASAGAGETRTGLPPSPVTHVGPAPTRPSPSTLPLPAPTASSPRIGAGTPPPIPAREVSGTTLPYQRIEDSVEIEIDVELEPQAPVDVDFTEPTERVDVETIDVDHLDPIEHTDPGGRQGPRPKPRATAMGLGRIERVEVTRVEVTHVGIGHAEKRAERRVARHVERRLSKQTAQQQPPPVAAPAIRTDGDATVPYPRTESEDPATVRFTRPYDRFEIEIARESETPHVVRELVAPKNLVHETQAVPKRDPGSAPYETLEIAPLRSSSTAQMLRQCERRTGTVWRWAIAGLILGAGAFAFGLSLAHLILR